MFLFKQAKNTHHQENKMQVFSGFCKTIVKCGSFNFKLFRLTSTKHFILTMLKKSFPTMCESVFSAIFRHVRNLQYCNVIVSRGCETWSHLISWKNQSYTTFAQTRFYLEKKSGELKISVSQSLRISNSICHYLNQ